MSSKNPPLSSEDFFRQLAEPSLIADLFNFLPGVYLFIKDHQHRYMKVSQNLAELHGCASESEMIGKCDFDFNPPALASQYVEEDRKVMDERKPLVDQIWLVQDAEGMPHWQLSTKIPLMNRNGGVMGVAGVMRPYDRTGSGPGSYQRLTAVCDHVLAHYGDPMEIPELARLAHLSVSQLQREFRRLFQMTPSEYILRVRLHMAGRQLESGIKPVGQIALDCGFYDQSHFTHTFRKHTGMSPLAYRSRFSPASEVRENHRCRLHG